MHNMMAIQGGFWDILNVICTYVIPILGLIALAIGVYDFHQINISQKVRLVSFGHESSTWKGEKLTVKIENCTKHVMEVSSIHIITNSYIFCLYRGEPILLEEHRTKSIDSGFLSVCPEVILEGLQSNRDHSFAIIEFENGTSVKSKFGGKSRRASKYWYSKRCLKYQTIPAIKNRYCGRVIPIGVKYTAYILDKDNKKVWESLLTSFGFMECSLNGVNQLSFEDEKDINCESIKQALIRLTDPQYTVLVNEIKYK